MSRLALRVAAYLCAGAIATVAVAWISAVWLPAPTLRAVEEAPLSRIKGLETSDYDAFRGERLGRTLWQVLMPSGQLRPDRSASLGQYGLPCRALEWQFIHESRSRTTATSGGMVMKDVWRPYMPWNVPFGNILPLRPIWTGLVFDVSFYSGLLALASGAWSAWRRARRRHRNLCERCGYDVHGLATCPECGRPTGGHHCAGGCASSSASSSA